MVMFKVGDLITGAPGNFYSITDKHCVAEILEIRANGEMLVKVVQHSEMPEEVGEEYTVEEEYFELWEANVLEVSW